MLELLPTGVLVCWSCANKSDHDPGGRMTRDDFLLVSRMSVPPKAAAPTASLPTGAAAAPVCQHLFCERKATNGDLCEQHADLMKDLRQEYYDLQREFEAGW